LKFFGNKSGIKWAIVEGWVSIIGNILLFGIILKLKSLMMHIFPIQNGTGIG
jgi:hypothetical protein